MASSSSWSWHGQQQLGTYGLAIDVEGWPGPPRGLQPVPPGAGWPVVRIARRAAVGLRPPAHHLEDSSATVLLIDGEHIELRRDPPAAVYHLRRTVDAHELVHPYLAGAAGIFSIWFGRMAFHAGGIVVDDRVWGVLGAKAAGKTTTLAHLHLRGVPVVTDDLLVLDRGDALAGPRFLDLRPPTVAALGTRRARLEPEAVRDGERFRVALPPLAPRLPFGGWIVLHDGPDIDVSPVPLTARLTILTTEHLVAGRNRAALLDLLSAPMWRWTRPRSWTALPAALDSLTDRLTGRGDRDHARTRSSS